MSIPTASAKQHLTTILEQQPDDSSYDELLRELAFARMIDRGQSDAENGRTASNEDVRREITLWRHSNASTT
jgi:predicted transcriptional regulator